MYVICFLITFVIPNLQIMKERLLEFLRVENKSSALFAEEIGVQPSGISHILSGRNNPSLDFVLKMLEKYQFLSTDWLLFGKGSMYKDPKMQTLFDEESIFSQNNSSKLFQNVPVRPDQKMNDTIDNESDKDEPGFSRNKGSSIARIVWFYDDNSFGEYFPRK
jgi:transcriptional regulator with XRE-family HTH domain